MKRKGLREGPVIESTLQQDTQKIQSREKAITQAILRALVDKNFKSTRISCIEIARDLNSHAGIFFKILLLYFCDALQYRRL